MNQKSKDLTSILNSMEESLRRIENKQSVESLIHFALVLRQECQQTFPTRYFSVDAWDILLNLYQAHKADEKIKISKLGSETAMIPSNSLRFVDMLMKDGFLYLENDASDYEGSYVSITQKGLDQLEGVLGRPKVKE